MSDPNTGNPLGMRMNSLPSNRSARYLAQIGTVQAQLTLVETQIAELLGTTVEEYDFSSGGGDRQKAKRRDVQPMFERWDNLNARLTFLEMKLYGRGLTAMNLRRK